VDGIFVAIPTRSGRIKNLIRRKAQPSTGFDGAAPHRIAILRPD
jgi:hypothetical protein